MIRTILVTVATLILALQCANARACTCGPISVAQAKRQADVVFAGRIEEVTLIDSTHWEPRAIFRFEVARVWKGDVTETFVMHSNIEASSCSGFFREIVEPGSVLLVYGHRTRARDWKRGGLAGAENANSFSTRPNDGEVLRQDLLDAVPDDAVVYTTDICTRTAPVVYAVEDFEKLGKARELGPLDAMPDPVLVESLRYIPNELPANCGALTNSREWTVMKAPPENAAYLIDNLEKSPSYHGIPKPPPVKYKDYWARNAQGEIGFCRISADDDVVCGNSSGQFRETGTPGEWYFYGSVHSYCRNPDGSRYEPSLR